MITTVNLSYSVSGQTITPVQASPYLLASNTVKYVKAQFALDENWASCDSVKAVWSGINSRIVTLLDPDGICYVPHELLAKQQKVYVNLTGSDFDGQTLVDRITTYPLYALNVNATAYIDGSETAPITPSQFEQFVDAVKDEVGKIKDIDSVELNADYTLTISFSDGSETTVGPIRGEQGETGNGIASAVLNDDYTLTLTFTDGTSYTTPSIRGEQGEQGEPGEVTLAQLSAVLPTDTASGAIASFPDGSDLFDYLSCVVNIEPVQDLHGYDKPWVGGAGANKYDKSIAVDDSRFTTSGTGTVAGLSRSDYIEILPNTAYYFMGVTPNNSGYSGIFWYDENKSFVRADGTNGATSTTPVNLSVTSPSTAKYVGINMFTTNKDNGAVNYPSTVTTLTPYSNICPIVGHTGVEVSVASGQLINISTNQSGAIDASGNEVSNATFNRTDFIPIDKASIYIKTSLSSGYVIRIHGYSASKTWVQQIKAITTDGTEILIGETVPSGVDYIRVSYPLAGVYTLELWQADTYSVSWQTEAGTVYGGTVDLVSGVLTVTHSLLDMSSGSFAWSYDGVRWQSVLSGLKNYPSRSDDLNFERYGVSTSASSSTEGMGFTVGGAIYIYTSNGTDAPSGNVWYPLATPTTYQLTPTQIHALLGQNNVWADCGDTSVTYKADVQRWVEKMLGQ